MRVGITSDGMGYDVRLSASDRRDFMHLLGFFKSCVRANCRSYRDGAWHVEKRAERGLSRFIEMSESAGAKVIQRHRRREVKTLEQMTGKQAKRRAA